jgi:hypothetical protein
LNLHGILFQSNNVKASQWIELTHSRPGFVAVYVTPHMAHVVPNRAFASREQRATFLALVQQKIRAAAAQA